MNRYFKNPDIISAKFRGAKGAAMFNSIDFLRHIILSLHPLSFTIMVIKELIDVNNNYFELYDWLGNFIGISYYFLFAALFKKNSAAVKT